MTRRFHASPRGSGSKDDSVGLLPEHWLTCALLGQHLFPLSTLFLQLYINSLIFIFAVLHRRRSQPIAMSHEPRTSIDDDTLKRDSWTSGAPEGPATSHSATDAKSAERVFPNRGTTMSTLSQAESSGTRCRGPRVATPGSRRVLETILTITHYGVATSTHHTGPRPVRREEASKSLVRTKHRRRAPGSS